MTTKRTARIEVRCPDCRKSFRVSRDRAGMRLKCSGCGALVPIPVPAPPPAEKSSARAKDASAKQRGKRSPIERAIVWTAIALLLCLFGVEWSARSGYRASLDALRVLFERDEEFSPETADEQIRGYPRRRTGPNWKTYRWFSFVNDYRIKIEFADDLVTGIDTDYDEADLLSEPSKPIEIAKSNRVPFQPDSIPDDVVDPVLRAADLERLGRVRLEGNDVYFEGQLRAIAEKLPLVEVDTGDEPNATWNELTFNTWNSGFDAVRFRSPLDVSADLYWAFGTSTWEGRWYIVPVKRTPDFRGFHTFDVRNNLQLEGATLPARNRFRFQSLLGGRIKGGEEYILWFTMDSEKRIPFRMALRLDPSTSPDAAEHAGAIANRIGVEYSKSPFPANEEGRLAADCTLGSMLLNGYRESVDFQRMLQSTASLRSELVAGTSAVPKWRSIIVGEGGSRFTALRFRGGNQPANLYLGIAAEVPVWWGIVPVNGATKLPPGGLRAEVGLPLDGLDTGPRSFTLLNARFNAVQPGQEYLLWFTSWQDEPVEVHTRLRLEPPPESGEVNAELIGRLLGIDLPTKRTPENLAAMLEWLPDLPPDHPDLRNALLHLISQEAPEVRVDADQPVEWRRLTIPKGQRVAAVRFASSLDDVGDLYGVLQANGKPRLHVTATNAGAFQHLGTPKRLDPDLGLRGVDRREGQIVSGYHFAGGLVEPGPTYVVWIADDDVERDRVIDLALRVVPFGSKPEGTSLRSIAAVLDLKPESPPTAPGSSVLGEHTGAAISVAFTRDGRRVISGGEFGTVRVWETDGKPAGRVLTRIDGEVGLLRVLDDERLAVLPVASNSVFIHDLGDGKRLKTISFDRPLQWATLSSDGEVVAARPANGETGGAITLRNTVTGESSEVSIPANQHTFGFALSPDGSTLVVPTAIARRNGSPIGLLVQHNVRDLAVTRSEQVENFYYDQIAFSDDGKRMAGSNVYGLTRVWDTRTGEVVASLAQEDSARGLTVSPDGRYVAFHKASRPGGLWDVQQRRVVRRFDGHRGTVFAVAFAPDGRRFATAGTDGTVRLWETEHGATSSPGLPTEPVANSLGMELVPIPAGSFTMGGSEQFPFEDNARPRHPVTITRPFLLGRTEVTVGQFRQFVEATEYRTLPETNGKGAAHPDPKARKFVHEAGLTWRSPDFEQTDEHPVVNIEREDALAFCKWLGEKEGKTYRLPTEAEWEYACRAGSSTVWSSGNYAQTLQYTGNCGDRTAAQLYGRMMNLGMNWSDGYLHTAPVGSFAANAWGLHDMHGNVWEYCSDWFDETYYKASPERDPRGPEQGEQPVARGGAFLYGSAWARSAYRGHATATTTTGFRVVREIARD